MIFLPGREGGGTPVRGHIAEFLVLLSHAVTVAVARDCFGFRLCFLLICGGVCPFYSMPLYMVAACPFPFYMGQAGIMARKAERDREGVVFSLGCAMGHEQCNGHTVEAMPSIVIQALSFTPIDLLDPRQFFVFVRVSTAFSV